MISSLFLCFLVYSFIGWVWEGLVSLVMRHKIVNRGFLNGPYCPIYGTGALLFVLINHFFDGNLAVLFLLGGLVACILEYLTSWVMELIFHARWWDYSDKKFNINGRVCLTGFVIFGLGAVAVHFVHPHLLTFVDKFEHKDIIAIIAGVIFALDVISTNKSFARFTRILKDFQNTLSQGVVIQYIQRGKNQFIAELNKRTSRILTYQQRRLIRAFPNYKSSYNNAYREVRKLYADTKYKPKKTAHARKNAKKIVK